MKVKSLILSLALLLGASSVWADDNVSVVKPFAINKGQTKKVAVALENAKAYSAFQMEILLPEGLTMSNPKSLRTSDETFHKIDFFEKDGITRVVAVSYKVDSDGKTIVDGVKNFIDGKSEIILFFDVTASDAYAGTGNIEVKNVKFVSADGTTQTVANASSESGLILGDANGDKEVDTKDAIKVIDQYLGKNPSGFKTKAADINLDGEFDTKDAIEMIEVYLGK